MLRSPVRVLDDGDVDELLALCHRDPVANVFVAGRVEQVGCDPRRLGGQLWGWYQRGRLVSACWAGANLVPVELVPEAVEAFAQRARRHGRRCSSIVGPSDAVLALWDRLSPSWGRAREVRAHQPLMVIDHDPPLPGDPGVRPTTRADLDVLLPACVAMFTEEVGYSPTTGDGGALYRQRVTELVDAGRSFARVDVVDGRPQVVFKAELGAVSERVVQVQGVWVAPERRGEGLSAAGMASVVRLARAERPVTVSLYVNDFNTRAVAAYRRAGFRTVGDFATVLF
ncbi:GNAT family N-acetyltransferase [Thalassiella azotivora]